MIRLSRSYDSCNFEPAVIAVLSASFGVVTQRLSKFENTRQYSVTQAYVARLTRLSGYQDLVLLDFETKQFSSKSSKFGAHGASRWGKGHAKRVEG